MLRIYGWIVRVRVFDVAHSTGKGAERRCSGYTGHCFGDRWRGWVRRILRAFPIHSFAARAVFVISILVSAPWTLPSCADVAGIKARCKWMGFWTTNREKHLRHRKHGTRIRESLYMALNRFLAEEILRELDLNDKTANISLGCLNIMLKASSNALLKQHDNLRIVQ